MVTLLRFPGGRAAGLLSLLLVLVVLQHHQSSAFGASTATGHDAGSGSGRRGLGQAGMAWIPGFKPIGKVRGVVGGLGGWVSSLLALSSHPSSF